MLACISIDHFMWPDYSFENLHIYCMQLAGLDSLTPLCQSVHLLVRHCVIIHSPQIHNQHSLQLAGYWGPDFFAISALWVAPLLILETAVAGEEF